ncbi:MAG: DegT/DnrJ/EryC1/StrS aminotransferase family protein [Dehalococcoidia bacterium]|nr:DegT/DnrJ/EryC1/StrS aminotransferase family protein [Dehalococcoidia bacterium]
MTQSENTGATTEQAAPLPFCRPDITDAEINEVVDTIRSGWLTTGPKTQQFEEQFKRYVGSKHAIAVSSCTAAMHLSLAAAGIGEGDEVITTPLTFCATVNVIIHQRATPVLADISLDDYDIDPEQVERRITPRTKAIMPVHYGGQPCKMDALLDIARRHKLLLIEDAAHAVGANYRGRPIGTIGDTTSFSFYVIKNLTTGEGGMITTNDDALADKLRLLRLHGMSHDAWKRYDARGSWYYEVLAPGFKCNMTDVQAALGLHQLERLEGFLGRRRQIVALYEERLSRLPELILPAARPEVRHAWHLYPIVLKNDGLTIGRDELIEELKARGIGTSVHFIPIHHHPYYQQAFGWKPGDFPNTDQVFSGLLSLPLFTRMSDDDVERVATALEEIIVNHRR